MENITFNPLSYDDVNFIFTLYNTPEIYTSAFLSLNIPQNEEKTNSMVNNWMKNKKQKHFIIKTDDEKIGIAQIYNINMVNQTCEVGILLLPKSTKCGIGSYTLDFLIEFSFNHLNLRKIEVSILSNNYASLSLFKKKNFFIEGTRHQSCYKFGKYLDIKLLGLFREV